MERVLIVAKTRMPNNACVGGLLLNTNRSVRLLTGRGSYQPIDTPFNVGEVWDIAFRTSGELIPPHIENIDVSRARLLGPMPHFLSTLTPRVQPWHGGPSLLFDNLLTFEGKSAYLSRTNGTPGCSTGYWLPGTALTLDLDYHHGQPYYRVNYTSESAGNSRPAILYIKYVGFADPIPQIPVGTLVRVSLAHWWMKPGERLARCYLQLSGWYL